MPDATYWAESLWLLFYFYAQNYVRDPNYSKGEGGGAYGCCVNCLKRSIEM